MNECAVFPVINLPKTGRNIARLRQEAGVTVRDLQSYFGFEYPQAIYKWQHGDCLPSVDNLLALARVLRVPMEDLLVYDDREVPIFLVLHVPVKNYIPTVSGRASEFTGMHLRHPEPRLRGVPLRLNHRFNDKRAAGCYHITIDGDDSSHRRSQAENRLQVNVDLCGARSRTGTLTHKYGFPH